jgi:hypothetical protein
LDIKDKVTGESLTTTEVVPIREWKAAYNGERFIDPKVQTKKIIKDPSVKASLRGLMKQRIAAAKSLRKDMIKPSNLTFKKSEIGDYDVAVIEKTKSQKEKKT